MMKNPPHSPFDKGGVRGICSGACLTAGRDRQYVMDAYKNLTGLKKNGNI